MYVCRTYSTATYSVKFQQVTQHLETDVTELLQGTPEGLKTSNIYPIVDLSVSSFRFNISSNKSISRTDL